jgi:hypothetical protein
VTSTTHRLLDKICNVSPVRITGCDTSCTRTEIKPAIFQASLCCGIECRARLKCDGTCAETRFGLSAKRTSPFKLVGRVGGDQFSPLLAAEVCASAVVMVVTLDTPCSEVECKTTGYPLHSHVSPSLPLPCVTVCHHVSTEVFIRSVLFLSHYKRNQKLSEKWLKSAIWTIMNIFPDRSRLVICRRSDGQTWRS